MNKAELRKIYLARQKNLLPVEQTEKSEQISNQFFKNFGLNDVNFLHCFLPIENFNEIETSPIFNRLWQNFPQIQTLTPRVNFQTGNLESVRFMAKTKLSKNVWDIAEPIENEIVSAEKIDLVLVPLLCFDKKGFRVGYGKGFYDRFLQSCHADCLKIGLSYFVPIAKISDRQNFDVKLDFCVTPEKIWRF